jgi:hypothetical protein
VRVRHAPLPAALRDLEPLIRHAERYGDECLYEGLSPEDALRLRAWIEGRRRRPAHETRAMIAVLDKAGLVPGYIAERLGLTEAYVRRILAEGCRRRPQAPAKAHG